MILLMFFYSQSSLVVVSALADDTMIELNWFCCLISITRVIFVLLQTDLLL